MIPPAALIPIITAVLASVGLVFAWTLFKRVAR